MLSIEQGTRIGTVLSGPLTERVPGELDWTDAWRLEVDVAYVALLPAEGRPLSGRVVVVDGASRVFASRAQLAADARVVGAEAEIGEPKWERQHVAALPAGVTASLRGELGPELRMETRTEWRRWALEVSRSADEPGRVAAALVLEGWIIPWLDPAADESEEGRGSPTPIEVRERVVFAVPPVVDGEVHRLILPTPTGELPHGGILIETRLVRNASGSDDFAAAVARGRELVDGSHGLALARVDDLDEGEGFRFESGSALSALRGHELQRPALVFLAQSTGANLTEELALVAAAETLGEYLAEIGQRAEALEHMPRGAGPFGWFLERDTFLWLCARAEDEAREIEPELFAVLTRHAGEMARYPDLLREIVQACGDAEALAEALLGENRIFIEDAHPAARVRAYDWLEARGARPAGFDPLASPAERRAALARLDAEAEAAANEAQGSDAGEEL